MDDPTRIDHLCHFTSFSIIQRQDPGTEQAPGHSPGNCGSVQHPPSPNGRVKPGPQMYAQETECQRRITGQTGIFKLDLRGLPASRIDGSRNPLWQPKERMVSLSTRSSLLIYLTALTGGDTKSGGTTKNVSQDPALQARMAATSKAALQTAGSTHQASMAWRALDSQQATLAADLRGAMNKAGLKLTGVVEFSVSSEGEVVTKGSDADKAVTAAFLKSDTSTPSFATRIATQARDALKTSETIQQSAAIRQAARYAGRQGDVMSLYASLLQQTQTGDAVFSISNDSSSLTYPGSLTTKA